MINVIAEITLNGITEVDVADFGGIFIYQSIEKGLPYGSFNLIDRGGYLINKFENLQIGTTVDIILKDIQDEERFLTLPTFYIIKIEDDFSLSASELAGTIRVWFGHPWLLFKDDLNHAYPPINHGKLIQQILEDETRGVKFEINKDTFKDTDDEGKYSRYKVCETDWNFIKNKILPYTSISNLPPLFFCNFFKKKEEKVYEFKFNLTTSSDLYEQKPKILITMDQASLTETEDYRAISEICKENNLEASKDTDIFWFTDLKLSVYYDTIPYIFPNFYLEDIENNKFYKVGNKLKNKLAHKEGATFGNKIPLDMMFMESINGTSANSIKNRILMDSLSMILSTGKNIDNTFSLILDTNFCGHKVTVGDTVEFYVSSLEEKMSWMRGKWIIMDMENFSNVMKDKYQLLSRLYLNRPSFIGNTNTTSLSVHQMLYEN